MDILPNNDLWRTLTVVPDKRRAYEEDLYFRETWSEWLALGGGMDSAPSLASVALLCAKPDDVVGRRLEPMLAYAVEHGFKPIGAQTFGLTRHSMREVWRYDWHVYPSDRLAYCTLWYTSADTVAFLLRDARPVGYVPASVRLSQLKGNAIASRRRGDELRSVLKSPSSVLNFVHVPDEPVDIIRELGILFGYEQRRRLMNLILQPQAPDGTAAARAAIQQLEQRYQPHDLDRDASLQRLVRIGALSAAHAGRLAACIESGTRLSWAELCTIIDPAHPRIDRWDFLSIASDLIPLEREGVSGLLPGVIPAQWIASAAP